MTGRPPALTEDETEEVLEKYQDGHTAPELAEEYDVSRSTIENRIEDAEDVEMIHQDHNRATTEKQDEEIIRLYSEEDWTVLEIADEFEIGHSTVQTRLREADEVTMDRNRKRRATTEEDEEQIVQMYKGGYGTDEIAEEFDIDRSVVRDRLNESDDVNLRKYGYLDESVFENPNNDPEAQYWAGFLLADGCISQTGGQQDSISIGLSSKDRQHLREFLDFCSAQTQIHDSERNGNEVSSIYFRSDKIAEDLSKLGMVPQKTGSIKAVDLLQTSSHFWRGMVDGDGTIYQTESGSGHEHYVLGLTGNKRIVEQFKQYLKGEVGIESSATIKHRKNNIYYYRITGYQDVLDSLIDLYQDAPVALDRKQQKAKEAIEFLRE